MCQEERLIDETIDLESALNRTLRTHADGVESGRPIALQFN